MAEEPPSKILLDPASSNLLSLPDEIVVNCLARVPRCYYPVISLVCKTFKRLIATPEIYLERSSLGRTERVLYVSLRSHAGETPRWYTLNSNPFENDHRLVRIPSFPSIPCWGMSVVAIDSEIYILGGCVNYELVSTVFVVDCRSHRYRLLPRMKQARGCAAVGIVNGKLYVIGGCDPMSLNWVEAFDLKTQTWETVLGVNNVVMKEVTIRSVVIDDKIYIMDQKNSFVYDPKGGKLERDVLLDTKWTVASCVIDDRLYAFGSRNTICVFDPFSRVWDFVNGLQNLPEKQEGSRMTNLSGNLAIMQNIKRHSTEILFTEIELERREGGKIWGKILWSNIVIKLKEPSTIVRCLAVTI